MKSRSFKINEQISEENKKESPKFLNILDDFTICENKSISIFEKNIPKNNDSEEMVSPSFLAHSKSTKEKENNTSTHSNQIQYLNERPSGIKLHPQKKDKQIHELTASENANPSFGSNSMNTTDEKKEFLECKRFQSRKSSNADSNSISLVSNSISNSISITNSSIEAEQAQNSKPAKRKPRFIIKKANQKKSNINPHNNVNQTIGAISPSSIFSRERKMSPFSTMSRESSLEDQNRVLIPQQQNAQTKNERKENIYFEIKKSPHVYNYAVSFIAKAKPNLSFSPIPISKNYKTEANSLVPSEIGSKLQSVAHTEVNSPVKNQYKRSENRRNYTREGKRGYSGGGRNKERISRLCSNERRVQQMILNQSLNKSGLQINRHRSIPKHKI